MSRLDQSAGGFGGTRVVKPQDNVYTVLLLVAILFVATALGVELFRFSKIKNPPGQAAPAPAKTVTLNTTGTSLAPVQQMA